MFLGITGITGIGPARVDNTLQDARFSSQMDSILPGLQLTCRPVFMASDM
jgi:hypothetical protein